MSTTLHIQCGCGRLYTRKGQYTRHVRTCLGLPDSVQSTPESTGNSPGLQSSPSLGPGPPLEQFLANRRLEIGEYKSTPSPPDLATFKRNQQHTQDKRPGLPNTGPRSSFTSPYPPYIQPNPLIIGSDKVNVYDDTLSPEQGLHDYSVQEYDTSNDDMTLSINSFSVEKLEIDTADTAAAFDDSAPGNEFGPYVLIRQVRSYNEASPVVGPILSASDMVAVNLIALLRRIGAPLYAYDEVKKWIATCKDQWDVDVGDTTMRGYRTYVHDVARSFDLHRLQPRAVKTVLRGTGTVVDIIVHDFTQAVYSLLSDPELMADDNLLLPPDGPFGLWPPVVHEYDDVNTGSVFRDNHQKIVGNRRGELMVGIALFIDKCHTDVHGRLNVDPVTFTLLLFNRDARFHARAWRTLGYITSQATHTAKTPRDSLEDYHHMVEVILDGIRQVQENEHGGLFWDLKYKGMTHRVLMRFVVMMVQGDSEGQDRLCGHYAGGRHRIAQICRYCHIPTDDIEDPLSNGAIKYRNKRKTQQLVAKGDLGLLKDVSQHLITNAWYSVSFGVCPRGIHGACPAEITHSTQLGLHVYAHENLLLVRKVTTKTSKAELKAAVSHQADKKRPAVMPAGSQRAKKKPTKSNVAAKGQQRSVPEKATTAKMRYEKMSEHERVKRYVFPASVRRIVDRFSRLLGRALQTQSDKDIGRAYLSSGVTSAAKKSAHEIQSVLLSFLFAMNLSLGWELSSSMGHHLYNAWVEIIEMLIMFEETMKKQRFTTRQVTDLRKWMPAFLHKYRRTINRRTGAKMKLLKFHLPMHLADDIERFGSPQNFSGGPGESRHKVLVKAPSKLTQRRLVNFEWQVGTRYWEQLVVNRAKQEADHITMQRFGAETRNPPKVSSRMRIEDGMSGKAYVVDRLGNIFESSKRGMVAATWTCDRTLASVLLLLKDYIFPCVDSEDITLFTEFNSRNNPGQKYRGHPNYNCHRVWQDFAYYDLHRQGIAERDVPAKLLVFVDVPAFKQGVGGILTPLFPICSPGLYAVAHTMADSCWGNPGRKEGGSGQRRKPYVASPASRLMACGKLWSQPKTSGRKTRAPAKCADELPTAIFIHCDWIKGACIGVHQNLMATAGEGQIKYPTKEEKAADAHDNSYIFLRPRRTWTEILFRLAAKYCRKSRTNQREDANEYSGWITDNADDQRVEWFDDPDEITAREEALNNESDGDDDDNEEEDDEDDEDNDDDDEDDDDSEDDDSEEDDDDNGLAVYSSDDIDQDDDQGEDDLFDDVYEEEDDDNQFDDVDEDEDKEDDETERGEFTEYDIDTSDNDCDEEHT